MSNTLDIQLPLETFIQVEKKDCNEIVVDDIIAILHEYGLPLHHLIDTDSYDDVKERCIDEITRLKNNNIGNSPSAKLNLRELSSINQFKHMFAYVGEATIHCFSEITERGNSMLNTKEENDKKEHMNYNIGKSNYSDKKIQSWDIIDEYNLSFYEGNVLKYLLREKGSRREDLQKIRHYIDKMLDCIPLDGTRNDENKIDDALKVKISELEEYQNVHLEATEPMDDYFSGMYNGMEYALSILDNRDPMYRSTKDDGLSVEDGSEEDIMNIIKLQQEYTLATINNVMSRRNK
jgi:hypothetical protein